MDQGRRPRARAVRRTAGAAVVLVTALAVLGSCTSDPPQGEAGPSASPTSAEQSRPHRRATPLPEDLARDRPGTLARRLDRAVTTLRDGQASPGDLRRAGELQQLATRVLADAGPAYRRRVVRCLDGAAARVTVPGVRASRLLGAMTTPQPRLPRWRILAPPSPAELLADYRAAQRHTGVPWTYLAAIHLVETRMGRIRGTSTAGARGPMQFLPSTWELYGAGGDINDPRDAIHAAARLLRANGAPGDMAGALWHYNPSESYVRAVSEYAGTLRRSPWVYRGYWHWRVLYRHVRGTYLLPVGYPGTRAVLLERR